MLTKTQEQVSRQAEGPEERMCPALTLVASKSCKMLPSISGTMLTLHSRKSLWLEKLHRLSEAPTLKVTFQKNILVFFNKRRKNVHVLTDGKFAMGGMVSLLKDMLQENSG